MKVKLPLRMFCGTPFQHHDSATVPQRQTNFVKMAEAFGAKGYSANTPEEFEECYRQALQEKGPVWIDCAIDKDIRVLPMIPGGGTVEDMITE